MPAAAPVAVGGVGGSGTRIVAQLLRETGIHMGDDLNDASDTLWFTLLFKRREILDSDEAEFSLLVRALVAGLAGGGPLCAEAESRVRDLAREARPQHRAPWLQARCKSLLAAAARPARGMRWGWKEPNTHVVIERLWQHIPGLRYVHVVRNGIDMAYSRNQNQLALWGGDPPGRSEPLTPRRSLAYWCLVHRRMERLLAENPQRMFWLDYDALCRDPKREADKLCRFLHCDAGLAMPILEQIREPAARDNIDIGELDPDDVEYARSLARVRRG